MPNGLCFSPDESLLYINDTPRAHIKVFDVAADGMLANGRMFFDGVGSGVIEEGIPDGMKCDERGNIWVTGPKGVWVISSDGEHLGTIEVPENTGNLTWGGDDWHTLYIPSSTSPTELIVLPVRSMNHCISEAARQARSACTSPEKRSRSASPRNLSTSPPRRMPPSISTGMRPATRSATRGSASIVAATPSSARPP